MTSQSNAAVVVTFEQVGNNVVATWNGSLDPGVFFADYLSVGGANGLGWAYGLEVVSFYESYDMWGSGSASLTTLSASPSSWNGGVFGFSNSRFVFNGFQNGASDSIGGINFGSGTAFRMTWSNTMLMTIGAASFNNTPAWQSSTGDTVVFTTIPEPSTALLGLLGIGAMLARRRR